MSLNASTIATTKRSDLTSWFPLNWLGYSAIFGLLLALWPDTFLLDDAYIALSKARAVLEGRDLVFGLLPLIRATSAMDLALIVLLGVALRLPLASTVLVLSTSLHRQAIRHQNPKVIPQ